MDGLKRINHLSLLPGERLHARRGSCTGEPEAGRPGEKLREPGKSGILRRPADQGVFHDLEFRVDLAQLFSEARDFGHGEAPVLREHGTLLAGDDSPHRLDGIRLAPLFHLAHAPFLWWSEYPCETPVKD